MLYGSASKPAIVAWTVVITSLATVAVVLRLYARFIVSRTAGRDDACIFGSVSFAWATTATMIAQVKTGLGSHEWTLGPHEAMLNLRAYWLMIIVYNCSLFCTKFSIMFQYLRIFPQRGIRIATYALMALVSCYATWRIISAILTCTPPAAFWDHSIKHKTCQDRLALSLASTSLNMITDILITVLPLPFLNKLQLPRRQKWALVGVFAIGGLVVIVSILRLPSLYHLMSSKDITYENAMACIWSSIELNTGIICSCLPTLRCLFPTWLKGASKYGTHSSSGPSFVKPDVPHTSDGWTPENAHSRSKSRCYTHVTSQSASFKTHKAKRSWTDRQDMLLESSEDIELGPRLNKSSSEERHVSDGHIHVQTDIEQESVLRIDDESPVLVAKEQITQNRGMV
ncbi:hypothetical protein CKM354_001173700 [Cercospora kikuchii]|uniref:Rhodopsin domain-containing protein n=1 Tax=Cercospora kikuchii TaxID=84275 RepID=A0A9P3CSU0_9PEZI|nr:uncharacterized protein CKM354_001173700 [Cercospora kikuchii]GIZ48687.1 hypothetical protein CKM354_001173700 [Cercospora kikuchii]